MTQTNELVGQVVEDRYRIESLLGAGGMGVVYLARHIKVGREVAIKVLREDLMTDPTMVERFEREAAIAARLAHRNLISVIDVGETAAKQKLMVLELARGDNLATIVARGALARERVIALTSQLLSGLEHAHSAGLVHRDLKPENVIVEVDEHGAEVPKIVDFGVALLRGVHDDKRLTTAGVVLGTPQYMAPEHAQGHTVDPRCDLFALGVMVYEMLGGRLPFEGTGVDVALANITQDPPPILVRTGTTVDPLLEAFARRLMARRVRDRFQSARAALDVLELVDTQRDAASEILIARDLSEAAPPRLRITALGTQAPANVRGPRASISQSPQSRTGTPRVFAARMVHAQPSGRAFVARVARDRTTADQKLALASTVEAEGTAPRSARRRRGKKQPTPTKPWQPWKSFGLLAGAALAGITVATLAVVELVNQRDHDLAVPSLAQESTACVPYVAIRTIALELPPPSIEPANPRASERTAVSNQRGLR